MKPHGYYKVSHTPALWHHATQPIPFTQFTLVVDDFGVKYTNKFDELHFLNTLKETYKVSEYWKGSLYCGINLKWDYNNRTLDVSMPGYVTKHLTKYKHKPPKAPIHTPLKPLPHKYSKDTQITDPPYQPLSATEQENKFIQHVFESFL